MAREVNVGDFLEVTQKPFSKYMGNLVCVAEYQGIA